MKYIKLFEDIDWGNFDYEEEKLYKIPPEPAKYKRNLIGKEVVLRDDVNIGINEYNPLNMDGYIINVYEDSSTPIRVRWANNNRGHYSHKDLYIKEPIKMKKNIKF